MKAWNKKKYNVPTHTLRSWSEKEEELKSVIIKGKKYRLTWGGHRSETEEIEPELVHWILFLRDFEIALKIKIYKT
jgi:hypothetical protein